MIHADRVEFFGGIGSGKSFFYRSLFGKKGIYVFEHQRPYLVLKLTMPKTVNCNFFRLIPYKISHRLTRNYIHKLEIEEFAKHYPSITDFSHDILYDRPAANCSFELAFNRIVWLAQDLGDLIMLHDQNVREPCVLDESFLMRGIGLAMGTKDPEAILAKFLAHAPLPNRAIRIKSTKSAMLSRISKRDGDGSDKINRAIESAETADLMADLLKDKIDILTIHNTSEGISETQSNEMLRFIKKPGSS